MEPLHSAESILSALPKSIGKRNVIEPFDRSYPQSTLMIELAKTTKLARWAILAPLGTGKTEWIKRLIQPTFRR